MKLLIQNNRIAGTATDDYSGPDEFITAPSDYDPAKQYEVKDGALTVPIPQTVTMRQARLALLGAGKLASVTTAIAAMATPQKEAAQIEWEYSQTVERHRPFVLLLGAALGLDDAALDALFVAAAAL